MSLCAWTLYYPLDPDSAYLALSADVDSVFLYLAYIYIRFQTDAGLDPVRIADYPIHQKILYRERGQHFLSSISRNSYDAFLLDFPGPVL